MRLFAKSRHIFDGREDALKRIPTLGRQYRTGPNTSLQLHARVHGKCLTSSPCPTAKQRWRHSTATFKNQCQYSCHCILVQQMPVPVRVWLLFVRLLFIHCLRMSFCRSASPETREKKNRIVFAPPFSSLERVPRVGTCVCVHPSNPSNSFNPIHPPQTNVTSLGLFSHSGLTEQPWLRGTWPTSLVRFRMDWRWDIGRICRNVCRNVIVLSTPRQFISELKTCTESWSTLCADADRRIQPIYSACPGPEWPRIPPMQAIWGTVQKCIERRC